PEVDEDRLALEACERERPGIERRALDRSGAERLEAGRRHRDVLRVDARHGALLAQPVGEHAADGDQRDESRDQPPAHGPTLQRAESFSRGAYAARMLIRAAVLWEAGTPLSVEEVELADPKAGEVRVRIAAAGVCRSDLHVMEGVWTYDLPMVLGHEGAGIVDAVGPGVLAPRVGEAVALAW